MARLCPAIVGALILMLAALFGQGRPAIAGAAGFAAPSADTVETGGAPAAALIVAALQSEEDPEDDLTDPVDPGDDRALRHAARRPGLLPATATTRRTRPCATGPPAEHLRA